MATDQGRRRWVGQLRWVLHRSTLRDGWNAVALGLSRYYPLDPVLGYVIALGRISGCVMARLWALNLVVLAEFDRYNKDSSTKRLFAARLNRHGKHAG